MWKIGRAVGSEKQKVCPRIEPHLSCYNEPVGQIPCHQLTVDLNELCKDTQC